uniref:IgGFc_binding domain-containing protein n=1 Tax=Rhabditophanes sp. KR3021 TaxID=114890 RepID=A0AC35U9B8_9BILA
MARVGGSLGNDGFSVNNAFMTIVPETTQYLTGPINIVTFSINSKLEIYGIGLIPSLFFIDGQKVPDALITKATLTAIDTSYSSYIVTVIGTSFHTFNTIRPYIAYVVGRNSDDDNDISMYGYLAGCGKSQLKTTPTQGWRYVLRLPKATSSSVQLISIIPIDSTKPLNGQLVTYKNGVYRDTLDFIINPTIDNTQALFVGDDSDGELAFNIYGTTAFIVTAAVPCVDLNYESTRKPSVDMLTCDYVAFMPFPIYSYDCQSTLSGLGEIKLLGGQFTNVVYETAGVMLCGNDLLVDFYIKT